MIKDVYIIFKTHLDIGYTDLAKNVTERYLTDFIPRAIETGYKLKGTDTPFVWTVGSWLIWQGLKHDTDGRLDRAIRDGIIAWHALPFTTHTELMSEKLFKYGLSLAKRLDERYEKFSVGAKMTDVPGHTAAIVPMLADAEVKMLHIGVNPSCPLPPGLPLVFKWKRDGKSINVVYSYGYGHDTVIGDMAIVFGHTNDNLGPQSAEEVAELYREIGQRYPGAKLHASTLNDVAIALENQEIPYVFEGEIGDTWIYGSESDPKKTALFRELQRIYDECGEYELDDSLICVAEHTCGMNIQNNLRDLDNWFLSDFDKVRDSVLAKLPESWVEQRDYAYKAAVKMGVDIEKRLAFDFPIKPIDANKPDSKNPPAKVYWQLFDHTDNEQMLKKYSIAPELEWAQWDFTKYGIPTDYTGGIFEAEVRDSWTDGNREIWICEFSDELKARHGLPKVYIEKYVNEISIKTCGKKGDRMPQALWAELEGVSGEIEIDKMGTWIPASSVVGAPLLSAFLSGIRTKDMRVTSYDCALIAPYGPHLYDYIPVDMTPHPMFCLYNNCWNTNFPQWFSDDMNYRFIISSRTR